MPGTGYRSISGSIAPVFAQAPFPDIEPSGKASKWRKKISCSEKG
jgi:hypothetical protein